MSVVVLRDGTRALIRPIGPDDSDRLKAGFEIASAGRTPAITPDGPTPAHTITATAAIARIAISPGERLPQNSRTPRA